MGSYEQLKRREGSEMTGQPSSTVAVASGGVVLIDLDDHARVANWKWHLHHGRRGKTYVARRDPLRKIIYLHRFIMSAPAGLQVDHINGNPLDNRRSNLRLCHRHENIANTRGYGKYPKGVAKIGNTYRARIAKRYIGSFPTPEDAGRAYDKAAIALFGSFANLNFPQTGPTNV